MYSLNSEWMMRTLELRCFRPLLGDAMYYDQLNSLICHTRDKWQPDEKIVYYTTLEQERRLSAERFIIKSIFTGFDHGTAGDAAEECWAELLRQLLPQYEVVLKGVIGGIGPVISPQIDILILDKNFPKNLLKTKVYPISSIVAAFECKLSLRLEDIEDAVRTARRLNGINSEKAIDPISKIPIFYGVLALSSGIENKVKPAYKSVLEALARHTSRLDTSLSIIDSVLAIDNFCLTGTRTIYCYDVDNSPMNMTFDRVYEFHGHEDVRPADSYLGLFIQKLLVHLEKSDSSLSNTRKMYDLFTRYMLEEANITSADLSGFISSHHIEKLASKFYSKVNTVYSLNI